MTKILFICHGSTPGLLAIPDIMGQTGAYFGYLHTLRLLGDYVFSSLNGRM